MLDNSEHLQLWWVSLVAGARKVVAQGGNVEEPVRLVLTARPVLALANTNQGHMTTRTGPQSPGRRLSGLRTTFSTSPGC